MYNYLPLLLYLNDFLISSKCIEGLTNEGLKQKHKRACKYIL